MPREQDCPKSPSRDKYGNEHPSEEFERSFQTLLEDDAFSDLTITCEGDVHKVHKAVVCSRSVVFKDMCQGDSTEAQTSTIHLSDQDPLAVEMMVQYFYTLKYHLPSKKKDENPEGYPEAPAGYPELTVHARVYALGEKYAISGLKYLARQNFLNVALYFSALVDVFSPNPVVGLLNYFAGAALEVYETTIESDRGLRDIVVEVVMRNCDVFMGPESRDMFMNNAQLSYDLFLNIGRRFWSPCN